MTTTVVGIFNSESAAQSAVSNLRNAGVPMDKISVIARPTGDIVNEQGEVMSVDEGHMTAGEGLTVGAVWGGLVGLAALAIPGIGPTITSNIFAVALTGAVAGAATGGIAGALIDAASVPEEHARVYEDRVRAGGTLVTAQVDDNLAAQARSILQTAGAEEFNWDDPQVSMARASADMNQLDNAGYVAGGRTSDHQHSHGASGAVGDALTDDHGHDTIRSADQAYDDSSKVGTGGGALAGAATGAAIGSVGGPVGAIIGGTAGAITGAAAGAVGDTIGEQAETETGAFSDANKDQYRSSLDRTTGYNDSSVVDSVAAGTRDVLTDDQGHDTIRTADQAYDNSSKVGTGGGALAGAATGAAIGSVGGPVGAIIGGTAGAITGAAAGAIGDTIGEEAETETGAFSDANKAQYSNTADRAENKLRDAGNTVERKLDADVDSDGDVGRRH